MILIDRCQTRIATPLWVDGKMMRISLPGIRAPVEREVDAALCIEGVAEEEGVIVVQQRAADPWVDEFFFECDSRQGEGLPAIKAQSLDATAAVKGALVAGVDQQRTVLQFDNLFRK